jgi:hypothetical protein
MAYLVEHPLAARLLADPDLAVCLKPFMKGPATVKDLAQARGISLQRAHYRVGLFLKAGLLEPVGVRRRRGRPIRLYRAVDTDFRIPRKLVPERILRALEAAQSWQVAKGPGSPRSRLRGGLTGLPQPGGAFGVRL